MPIKKNAQPETLPLSLTNEPFVVSQLRTPLKETQLRFLLFTIAETLDGAASGAGCWLSIGKNQDGTAFLLTYHEGRSKAYATGQSLAELASNCRLLLEDAEKL